MHAYARLTPDTLLDALEAAGLTPTGELLALNSFENRVFRAGFADGSRRVVKVYRPARWSDAQILEEHAFVQALDAAEVPVAAPLVIAGRTLFEHAGFRWAVFPVRGGRAPELDRDDTLVRMGRLLGRLHAVGARQPFVHRPALDLASFGYAARDVLGPWIPRELAGVWHGVVEHALTQVERCYARAGTVTRLRLHGDCHPGNVLWTDAGAHLVDFDDCRSGPAVQDLWMLLPGEREAQGHALAAVLEGYEEFVDFDDRELHLIEGLRTLRLLHHAAWIAQRWNDPAFPAAFPWFDTPRYWEERLQELREQIALMDEPPLAV